MQSHLNKIMIFHEMGEDGKPVKKVPKLVFLSDTIFSPVFVFAKETEIENGNLSPLLTIYSISTSSSCLVNLM